MLNKIFIMGRMTRDPDIKQTNSGKTVALFALACERDFKNQSGEKETDFIDCVCYGQTAEFVKSYFSKGGMAVVVGRLQLRDWTDRDGNKRRQAEIVCENVYFGEAKRRDGMDQLAGRAADAGIGGYAEPDGDLPWMT